MARVTGNQSSLGNFKRRGSRINGETCYGHGGWYILKSMSNYIFYQVEELIQRDLKYLVQRFGSFSTQISKFLGLGELYVPMDSATDQIRTWGLVHIKEHVQLHILLGGWIILCTIGIVGAGV